MEDLKNSKNHFFYNYYEKGNESKRLSFVLLFFSFIVCPLFAFLFKYIGAPISYFYSILSAIFVFPAILFFEKTIPLLKGKIPLLYFIFFNILTQVVIYDLYRNKFLTHDLVYFFTFFSVLNFALQRFYLSLIYFLISFISLVFFTNILPDYDVDTKYILILHACIGIFYLVIYYSRNNMIDSIEDHNSYLKRIVNKLGNGVILFQIRGNTIHIVDYNRTLIKLYQVESLEEVETRFTKEFSIDEVSALLEISEEDVFKKECVYEENTNHEISISKLVLKNGVYFLSLIQDITEKVKENKIILLNEKKYKNVYNRNQTGIFTLSLDAELIDCNPAFYNIFELENIENFQLFPKEKWLELRELILKKDNISNYNYTFKKDFDTNLFLVINFYFDSEQNCIEGNIVDITDLTISTKTLQEKENKYRLIYEEGNDIILLLDEDRIVDINQQGLKLFQESFDSVYEKSLWDYTFNQSPELKKKFDDYFQVLKAKKQIKFSWTFNKDSTFIETSISIVETKIGDNVFYQCVIHDETDRNKYLKGLEQSKKTFESILENTPEGFLIVKNQKAIYANKEFYQIFHLDFSKEVELNEKMFGLNFPKFEKIVQENKLDKQKKQKQIQFFIDQKVVDIDLTIVSIIFEEEEAELMIFKDISFQNKLSKEQLRAELAEETSKRLAKEIEGRKQIEFKLETEYLRTKAIFDSSENTLLLTLTPDLKLSSFNQHSKTYFDLQTKKEIRKDIDFEEYFEQIISPIKLRYFRYLVSSIRKGKSYQIQLKFINRDNEKKWVEIYLNPIKNLEGVVSEISLVAHDITEKKNNEREIMQSLKEKEVLLKEVHHRVKNNLQIISSILNLQSSYIEDKKILEIIEESRHRIRSMAIIHENLYQTTNFSSINFKNYSRELIRNLISSYHFNNKAEIQIEENVDLVELSLDQAIPCGLIINELITNSLKYAFEKQTKGIIYLELSHKNDTITLVVGDNGVGLPKNFDLNKTETLGLQLVATLVEQLDGNIKLEKKKGIKYFITFEKQKL